MQRFLASSWIMIVCYLILPPGHVLWITFTSLCPLSSFPSSASSGHIARQLCHAWLCQIQLQLNWVPNFPNSKISKSSRSSSSYLELEILCLFGSEGCTTYESYDKATTKGNSELVIKRLCTQGVHHCQCAAFIIDNHELLICTIFWWVISWNYDNFWH